MLRSQDRTNLGWPVSEPWGVVVEHAICSSLFIAAYAIGEWISLRASDASGPGYYIASGPAFAVFMVDGLAWLLSAERSVSVAGSYTWSWPLQLLLITTAYLGWTWFPASTLVVLQHWVRRWLLRLGPRAVPPTMQTAKVRLPFSFWAWLPALILSATVSAYCSAALYMSYPVWAFVFRDIWQDMFWRTFVAMEIVLLAPALLMAFRQAVVCAWRDLAHPRRVNSNPQDEQAP